MAMGVTIATWLMETEHSFVIRQTALPRGMKVSPVLMIAEHWGTQVPCSQTPPH